MSSFTTTINSSIRPAAFIGAGAVFAGTVGAGTVGAGTVGAGTVGIIAGSGDAGDVMGVRDTERNEKGLSDYE